MGMLILDRQLREGFHIGNDIEVVVLGWDSKKVRIGIDAPRGTVVLRNELLLEKRRRDEPLPNDAQETDDIGNR